MTTASVACPVNRTNNPLMPLHMLDQSVRSVCFLGFFCLKPSHLRLFTMSSPVGSSSSQRDNLHREESHSLKYSMETERLVPSISDFDFQSDRIQRRSFHGSRIRCATPWILLFTVVLVWTGFYLQQQASCESIYHSPYSQ